MNWLQENRWRPSIRIGEWERTFSHKEPEIIDTDSLFKHFISSVHQPEVRLAEEILDKHIPYEGNYRHYSEDAVLEAMQEYADQFRSKHQSDNPTKNA